MADLQTIGERVELKDAVVAYVGDGNNMANSMLLGFAVLGLSLRLGTPASHRPAASARAVTGDVVSQGAIGRNELQYVQSRLGQLRGHVVRFAAVPLISEAAFRRCR